MASPFGKASSPFVDKCGGSNSGLRRFGGVTEVKTPFQLPAGFGFGKVSPFDNTESMPKNPFQQSKLFDDGISTSKTPQTLEGSSFLGHASTSPFSFGITPSFERTGDQEKQKNSFQQSTPFGRASTSPGKSSPFASGNIHNSEPKNPFQNSTRDVNRSTWSQKEMGSSKIGGGSPSFIAPFGCYQNPWRPFASGSGSESTGPAPSFRPLRDSKPDFGNNYNTPWTFSPSDYGNLPSNENAECMEEETLISLSATPLYENTSPEELRWEDMKAAASQRMTYQVAPSGPFSVPNMCNGDAAPSNSQIVTPNSVDSWTPVICKFNNNGGSPAPSSTMSSAGWSFGSMKGTQSLSPSFNPLSQATPASSPFSPALPFSGFQNQSQIVPPSPFGSSSAAFGLSSGVSCISTLSCPPQAPLDVTGQVENFFGLEWPQSSLQAPVLSLPSPLTTITSSPSAVSVDHNIFLQRALAPAAPANSYAVTSGMSFTVSNTESGSLVRHGISSLPDDVKYSQPRTISLLTSKQVFEKTVIRMQSRRQGSLKKDGPRVSFLNDYSDPEDSGDRDASFVARKNPKEFLFRTPWLNNSNGEPLSTFFLLAIGSGGAYNGSSHLHFLMQTNLAVWAIASCRSPPTRYSPLKGA